MAEKKFARNIPYMKMAVGILRAGQIIDHKVSEVLKEYGITHIQFNVLRLLEAEYPNKLSLGEVSRGLLFRTSDVSRLIDRLVKREMIERILCPVNRRKVEITITQQGQAVIDASIPKIDAALGGYYKNEFNQEERDLIIGMMRRIR